MSLDQVKGFLEKVQEDKSLQEKLNQAADDPSVVAAIAKEAGFIFSADLITKSEEDPSDDELMAAAGGGVKGEHSYWPKGGTVVIPPSILAQIPNGSL